MRLIGAGASLLGLGLVMGFSPSLYTVVLHLLTHEKRAATLIRWLVLGAALGATVLLFAFRAVDPSVIAADLRARTEEFLVRRSVDWVAGGVFLVLGLVQWRRARRPPSPPRAPRAEDARPGAMVGIGFLNTMIGFSGPVTMYITGRVIRGASPHLLLDLPLYAVFLVGLAGPYLLAAWAWSAFPRGADAVQRGAAWMARQDIRPWTAVGLFLAGAVFLALGFGVRAP